MPHGRDRRERASKPRPAIASLRLDPNRSSMRKVTRTQRGAAARCLRFPGRCDAQRAYEAPRTGAYQCDQSANADGGGDHSAAARLPRHRQRVLPRAQCWRVGSRHACVALVTVVMLLGLCVVVGLDRWAIVPATCYFAGFAVQTIASKVDTRRARRATRSGRHRPRQQRFERSPD